MKQLLSIRTTAIWLSVFLFFTFLCIGTQASTRRELLQESKRLIQIHLFDSAIVVGQQALEKAISENGKSDSSVALILHRIASAYQWKGEYNTAANIYAKALSIWNNFGEDQSINKAKTLGNYGTVMSRLGEFAKSVELFEESLELKLKFLPENHPSTATTYNNFGDMCISAGKYARAEEYLLEAIKIRKISLPEGHPRTVSAINNLGKLYYALSRFESAEELFLQAMSLLPASVELKGHLGFGVNVTAVKLALGKYREAEIMCREGLAMLDTIQSSFIYDEVKGLYLKNLGIALRKQEKYTEAEIVLQDELKISEKIYNQNNPEMLNSLYNMSNLYRDMEKFKLADSLYEYVLNSRKTVLGQRHPDVALTLLSYARSKLKNGKNQEALVLTKDSYEIAQENFSNAIVLLSEQDALRHSFNVRSAGLLYLSCLLSVTDHETNWKNEAANIILSLKGTVTAESFARRRLFESLLNSGDREMIEDYNGAREELVKLMSNKVLTTGSASTFSRIDSLETFTRTIEKQILKDRLGLKIPHLENSVTVAKLIQSMPTNSCFIEFLEGNIFDKESRVLNNKVIALVIDNEGVQAILTIATKENLDSIIAEHRKHIMSIAGRRVVPNEKDRQIHDSLSHKLYEALWEPISKFTINKDMVFIAPDGPISLVPFAALVDNEQKYLVESTTIHYLSSGKDFLRIKPKNNANSGLLIFADPDFDATLIERQKASVNQSSAIVSEWAFAPSENTGNLNPCGSILDINVKPIPKTREEAEGIEKNWSANQQDSVYTFLGAAATEDNFKQFSKGKRALHFATHGFYLRSECEGIEIDYESNLLGRRLIDNPLLYCGLVLAGGNLQENEKNLNVAEDGILTALEVSLLDLEGTELAVLSACETGIGDIQAGEGVYGLRRAFQLAGVNTVVSSLWPISDLFTSSMIDEIYNRSELPVAKRVILLQRSMLEKLREDELSEHPYLWAGFVATGDWR